MKTLLTLFVLLFSSSVVAEEQYLECIKIENKIVDTLYEEFLGDEKLYLKLFDVRILTAITTPEKMESKEVKEFYKNNPQKALEFYADKTFKKVKENEYNSLQGIEYSRLTRMMQIEDLKVIGGIKENPLKQYYVFYANKFTKSLFQKIVIINRYTLRAFIIDDYRLFTNSESKFKKIRNLNDELINKNYPSLSYDNVSKTFNYNFDQNKPWSYIPESSDRDHYQCQIIKKSKKLI